MADGGLTETQSLPGPGHGSFHHDGIEHHQQVEVDRT